MRKLSKFEVNVIVNEVVNGLREVENKRLIDEFENCSKKDKFLDLCKEMDELENSVSELRKKLVSVSSEIKEEIKVNVVYRDRNSRLSNLGGIYESDKLYNIFNGVGMNNINYGKIESEIILSRIEGIDVRNLISEMIEKFKK